MFEGLSPVNQVILGKRVKKVKNKEKLRGGSSK
jgi:hypothetical protein